jgi:hypothetical protein
MRSLDSNFSRSLSAPPFGSVSFQAMTPLMHNKRIAEAIAEWAFAPLGIFRVCEDQRIPMSSPPLIPMDCW